MMTLANDVCMVMDMSNTATTWSLPLTGKANVSRNYNIQTGKHGLTGALTGWFDTAEDAEAAVLAIDPCAAVIS